MPSKLVETRERVAAKRAEIAKIFSDHPDLDLSDTDVADVQTKNRELADLGTSLTQLEDLERIRLQTEKDQSGTKDARQRGPAFPTGDAANPNDDERNRIAAKTLGDLFVESDAFTKFDKVQRRGPTSEVDLSEKYGRYVASHGVKAALDLSDEIGMKATLSETGFAPQSVRIPLIVTPGEETNVVAGLFPQGTTTQIAIPYMEETTTTNAAAETSEGAAKPESELAFTQKSTDVRKIATFLPVTQELFDDVPAMRSYVENRLRSFIAAREDGQLLNGDGAAPNLRGILNTANILTQAKAADPAMDAFFKAIIKIATTAFLDASGIVMNALDWQAIRLLRTADGIYILGNPNLAGPKQLWGLPVVTTSRIAQGTGLVGAFRDGAQIFRRSDVAFAVSDSHSDFFQKNLLALRVEERLALAVFRPSAFCTVTGL